MIQLLISQLRDKSLSFKEFRNISDRLSIALACESAQYLKTEKVDVETPLMTTTGVKFTKSVTLIPILRSGLAMLPAFLEFYPNSKVGFVGMRRDEETANASMYYQNIPEIQSEDTVILLDPMIATGGSAHGAIKQLKKSGVQEEQILFVGIIASPEGLERLNKYFPKMTIFTAQVDDCLNEQKFILPGIGDYGDRYFGTES